MSRKSVESNSQENIWRIWIDTGGTFTDCLALDDRGTLRREKVLSSGALRGTVEQILTPRKIRIGPAWDMPKDFISGFEFRLLDKPHPRITIRTYDPADRTIELDSPAPPDASAGAVFEVHSDEEAPVLAARLVTATPAGSPLPAVVMRLASTRGTNALLERRGVPVALFVTRGFGDLLRIGDQQRPDLFALDIRKSDPFYETVIEVDERIDARGHVLTPLKPDELAIEISRLAGIGIRSAAVAMMHSHANPKHEHELARYLLANGFHSVSCSSDLAPFIKIVPRAETAVVDAYLTPVIGDYLERVQSPLGRRKLHAMTSAGGMVQPASYHAKDSLLSGPAGGVVGAAAAGRRSGFTRIIAFDMGGTSTDVSRYDGDYDYVFEHTVGAAHLVAPALAIESVAAGGGSICRFDGEALHVGPESAGADPGPTCYGAGGPLTLTDVNLLLGRLEAGRFGIPIRRDLAVTAFEAVRRSIETKRSSVVESEPLLEGLREIANERMADAIRRISIRKGYDPAEYALVAFGGAGGQHACAVAEHLGIDTIVIPEDASLLSAKGLGHAVIERFAERQVLETLGGKASFIPGWIDELSARAVDELKKEGVSEIDTEIRRIIVNLRFAGQESAVPIDFDAETSLEAAVESKYRTIFGYYPEGRSVEIESIRVVASSRPAAGVGRAADGLDRRNAVRDERTVPRPPAPQAGSRAWFGGRWQTVPTLERHQLSPGDRLDGPALLYERYSVTAVEEGWTAEADDHLALILRRRRTAPAANAAQTEIVRLELFTSRFTTIAREMGEMLRRTAVSTNVKERLDFSCAVLDAGGELVVNAPHIPVHLGAIGMCVRGVRDAVPMEPGDVVVTNHPRYGGSHLPDVTVVSPVFQPDGTLVGYVANRAHHAEIGGSRPGSMPPAATTLAEEGVVIPPTYLFKHDAARWEDIERILSEAPCPSRAVGENLADLRAAVAANRRGAAALLELVGQHGVETVRFYMSALKKRAESKIRAAISGLTDGTYEAAEHLDDGSTLRARITISGENAHIDFSGSAGVNSGSLNTTPAVVMSTVIYVMRLLVREELPLNEGLLRAVTVEIPPGILNPPFPDDPARGPAVVGGNVETSQRIVDCLLKALGLAACSQGTMNNVSFGTDSYSYYETVCGGAGAGPGFDGASAVHTHMTNTRITDPEIIEHRYPIRLERFAIRRGSGGDGAYRGGDGVVREITFLDDMTLSVLRQHHRTGPYGLLGGRPGKPAVHRVVRGDGEVVELGPVDGCDVRSGDRFILETPGGGGYGSKKTAPGG
ncbi:MAG: hydantoinase B/oxoprolinase family protein [bacterium]